MITHAPTLLLLFPGALGDFICFLPTLTALQQAFDERVVVAARPSLFSLLPPHIGRFSIDRREVADLFGRDTLREDTLTLLSGFTHIQSWTGHGDDEFARRLRSIAQAQVEVHSFRGMGPNEHAAHYYARCAQVTAHPLVLEIPATALAWANELLQLGRTEQTLVIHAGSGGPRKNWDGFSRLAERWRKRGSVIWIVGPTDDTPSAVDRASIVRDQPLLHIAALLRQAPLYVGNDSGISHLAGVVAARGVALFGPTDPIGWRPLGLHVLRGAPTSSAGMHDRFHVDQLSVDIVERTLISIARGSS